MANQLRNHDGGGEQSRFISNDSFENSENETVNNRFSKKEFLKSFYCLKFMATNSGHFTVRNRVQQPSYYQYSIVIFNRDDANSITDKFKKNVQELEKYDGDL